MVSGSVDGGLIFFLPSGPTFVPQKLGKILKSSGLKPGRRSLPDDKLAIVLRAKRKASRKCKFGNKLDLGQFSEHAQSGNWQRYVSDEFSRRMKDLLMGVRLKSFDLMSRDMKSRQQAATKCKCCQLFEGKPFRKCLQESKPESSSKRWDDGVIFATDVTEGHLRGQKIIFLPRSRKLPEAAWSSG